VPNMQLQLLNIHPSVTEVMNHAVWALGSDPETESLEEVQSSRSSTPPDCSPSSSFCPSSLHVPKKRNRNGHENLVVGRIAKDVSFISSGTNTPSEKQSGIQQLSPCAISTVTNTEEDPQEICEPLPMTAQLSPRENGESTGFGILREVPRFPPVAESPLRLSDLMDDVSVGESRTSPTKAAAPSTPIQHPMVHSKPLPDMNDEQRPAVSSKPFQPFTPTDSPSVHAVHTMHLNELGNEEARSLWDLRSTISGISERCIESPSRLSELVSNGQEDHYITAPTHVAGSFTPVNTPSVASKHVLHLGQVDGPTSGRGTPESIQDVQLDVEQTSHESGSTLNTHSASNEYEDEFELPELAPSPTPSSQAEIPWHSNYGVNSSTNVDVADFMRESIQDPDVYVEAHSVVFRSGNNPTTGPHKVIFSLKTLLQKTPEDSWLILVLPGLPYAMQAPKGDFLLHVPDGIGFEIMTSVFDEPEIVGNRFHAQFSPVETLAIPIRACPFDVYPLKRFHVNHVIKETLMISHRSSQRVKDCCTMCYHAICSIQLSQDTCFTAGTCSFSILVEGGPQGAFHIALPSDSGHQIIDLVSVGRPQRGTTRIDIVCPVSQLGSFGIFWQVELKRTKLSFWAPQIRPFVVESRSSIDAMRRKYENFHFPSRFLSPWDGNEAGPVSQVPANFATSIPPFDDFDDGSPSATEVSDMDVSYSGEYLEHSTATKHQSSPSSMKDLVVSVTSAPESGGSVIGSRVLTGGCAVAKDPTVFTHHDGLIIPSQGMSPKITHVKKQPKRFLHSANTSQDIRTISISLKKGSKEPFHDVETSQNMEPKTVDVKEQAQDLVHSAETPQDVRTESTNFERKTEEPVHAIDASQNVEKKPTNSPKEADNLVRGFDPSQDASQNAEKKPTNNTPKEADDLAHGVGPSQDAEIELAATQAPTEHPVIQVRSKSEQNLQRRFRSARQKIPIWLVLAILSIFMFAVPFMYLKANLGLVGVSYNTTREFGNQLKLSVLQYGVRAANNTMVFLDQLCEKQINEAQPSYPTPHNVEFENLPEDSTDNSETQHSEEMTSQLQYEDQPESEADGGEPAGEFREHPNSVLPNSFRELHGVVCDKSIGCLRILEREVDDLLESYFLAIGKAKLRPIDRHRGPLTFRDRIDYFLGWPGPKENDFNPKILQFHSGFEGMTESGPVIKLVK
jgi:hypothetical protein